MEASSLPLSCSPIAAEGNPAPTLWFTGLPCSGKTTVSRLVAQKLAELGVPAGLIDGDEFRRSFARDLGFSKKDREENVRRVGAVCRALSGRGVIALAAFVSPYRAVRQELRRTVPGFLVVYVNCPVEECIRRDVKGMYRRAIAGEILNFTGVSDPYEPPIEPDLVLRTAVEPAEESARRVIALLADEGWLRRNPPPGRDPQAPMATLGGGPSSAASGLTSLAQNGPAGSRTKALLRYLGDAYARPINLAGIAAELGVSVSRLEHVVKRESGQNFRALLREARLARASALLAGPDVSIKQAALGCGYASITAFCRSFKRRFGCTPTEFRQRVRITK